MIGIYTIRFGNKMYVGRSVNIKSRISNHKSRMKSGIHHNSAIQNHFNKYGAGDFVFEIIETCSLDDLAQREHDVYMELLNKGKRLVNSTGFVGQELWITREGRAHHELEESDVTSSVLDWQKGWFEQICS